MELSLKDAISVLDVVKTIDWYSITLWLAISLPFYYVLIKKLIPDPEQLKEKSTKNWFIRIFTMPKIDSKVLFISLILFVIGTFSVIIGQNEKERIRNLGWTLKNYMINNNTYSMADKTIIEGLDMCPEDLDDIVTNFPNEFSFCIDKTLRTILLTDSFAKSQILTTSEKILAAYLNNDSVLSEGKFITFDDLFKQNDFFTYPVIYKLISDSGSRFSLLLPNINNNGNVKSLVKLKRKGYHTQY